MGALFIYINSNLNLKRKKVVKKSWQKLLEVALFSLVTSSVFYWAPLIVNECTSNQAIS